nr:PREDICTED: odorant receptor 46a, isoform A-like [Tribolium castaneum]|eukprot:XP_015839868.1 PREDICTED: odorant receptor 46a, isoform A-like [Tribolium castaneum]
MHSFFNIKVHNKMPVTVTDCFGVNLTVMGLFGMYHRSGNPTIFEKVIAYCMFFFFTIPIPILGSLYFFFQENVDLEELHNNGFLIAEMVCNLAKYLSFIKNGHRIRKCIHYLELPIFATRRENQERIINASGWICKRNSRVFFVSVLAANVFWAGRPFMENKQKFPIEIWLPFDAKANAMAFYLIYLFLVIAVAYASIACAVIDPLIAGLASLASGQVEVLKDNLENLSKYTREQMLEKGIICNKFDEVFYANVRKCVDHHNAILHFIKEYEECFSSSVFSQFLGSILVICFCCLELTKIEPLSFNFYSMTFFATCFSAQIYMYCYYGTVLYDESNSIASAIYMGTWYEYDVKSRKALINLMERSKKPIHLRAGKVLEMSVETFTMVNVTFTVPVFGLLYIFLETNITMKRMADDAFVVAGMWCYGPKLWPLLTKRTQIEKCIRYFENPQFVTLRENQTEIIKTHSEICKRNSKAFAIFMTTAVLIWATKPFLFGENNFPVDVWLPFDPKTDLKKYYLLYVFVASGVVYGCVANGAMDPLIAGLVCLAAGHFKVLKDNLQYLYKYTREDLEKQRIKIPTNQIFKCKLFHQKLKDCIRHHIAILQFVKMYETNFSFIVFNQFLFSILILGFLIFQLSILEPLSYEFLQAIIYMVCVVVQIYFYCYYGTILYEESNSLNDAVYMGNWYKYDIKSRKTLLILMERSKKPCIVTAGKVLDLSLVTFTTILRRSYSLLAVLKNQK